jgi:broad specificity phosphatase PhoE
MPLPSRRMILTAAFALLATQHAIAQTPPRVDDMALAAALRGGGLVILLRHGATFADQADAEPFNFDDISTQRNLTDAARALVRTFGDALRQAGVATGKVYTSKFNRAYQTAALAGLTDIERTADLTLGDHATTPAENARRADALRNLLATPPKPGTNTLLVTHKPNILDALGEEWVDVEEGEASIFRPENGKFVLVARLQMTDWPRIGTAMDR